MFFNFIDELREAGIKASFKEHLSPHEEQAPMARPKLYP